MTQDTKDVVARLAQIAELILDGTILGVGSEKTVREAADLIEALQADRQSLSDRIDVLEGVVDDAASCLKEAGHTISRLEHGSLGNRNFAYVAADHARAALHQEGIAPGEDR